MRLFLRRWLPAAAAVILCLPMMANLLLPGAVAVSESEQRRLAAPPDWPKFGKEFATWPRKVDLYANDHFGLRAVLIDLGNRIIPPQTRNASHQVLLGQDGWMFVMSDNMIEQSRGDLLRSDDVARTAALIQQIQQTLSARGIHFLFASPPNASTIYPDKLPNWARNPGQLTEYDEMLSLFSAFDVPALDLRAELRKGRKANLDDLYFHQDTHWSPTGVIVSFNSIARRMGHSDWVFDPVTTLGPTETGPQGDLLRMLNDPAIPQEVVRPLNLPVPKVDLDDTTRPFSPYRTSEPKPTGTRLLIIGDSFTRVPILPLVASRAAQVAWTEFRGCGFDFSMIDRFKPDEVWMMPTERQIVCLPNVVPLGM